MVIYFEAHDHDNGDPQKMSFCARHAKRLDVGTYYANYTKIGLGD